MLKRLLLIVGIVLAVLTLGAVNDLFQFTHNARYSPGYANVSTGQLITKITIFGISTLLTLAAFFHLVDKEE